ncbi:glycoside hydrolase family 113 [Algoriphagus oliviformis]|uniref:glycoside hydrolase family 113 n=1 Tax=Algoriphagus oliviformis TaxID=2811231 RepID=UPI001F18D488|nr:hypothetical protein [Algoriphagus oliviformis]
MVSSFRKYLFSTLGLLVLAFSVWFFIPANPLPATTEKWKGVNWEGSRRPLRGGEFLALQATGANAISQTPFGWQRDKNDPEIGWDLDNDKRWWGESPLGIQVTMDSSAKYGMKNMLKPHLWVRGAWVGEIEMLSEEDWKRWFANYTAFIVGYAGLAESLGIPALCVGTELEKTSHREEDWRAVIAEVRKVYSGKLTYAANFTEYQQVKFWDALDYIGIQAYFPLSSGHSPGLAELKASWQSHLPKIEKLVRKCQKPVFFTEIGYCNTVDAAMEPWVWPNEREGVEFSDEVQARCYEAFFETAWKKKWLAGVFFWKWHPEVPERQPDFTPQGKAAERVMTRFFSSN